MENTEIIDNQEIENQEEQVDVNAILEENEKLKKQVEADKHIKERLANKKEKKAPEYDEDALLEKLSKKQELQNFISQNPELSPKQEEIKTLIAGGLTLEEAKGILIARDPTIKNREKSNSMTITTGEFSNTKTTYTSEELEKIPQAEYNRLADLRDKGQVVFVR